MSLNGKVSVLLLLSSAIKYLSFFMYRSTVLQRVNNCLGFYSCNGNGSD